MRSLKVYLKRLNLPKDLDSDSVRTMNAFEWHDDFVTIRVALFFHIAATTPHKLEAQNA